MITTNQNFIPEKLRTNCVSRNGCYNSICNAVSSHSLLKSLNYKHKKLQFYLLLDVGINLSLSTQGTVVYVHTDKVSEIAEKKYISKSNN